MKSKGFNEMAASDKFRFLKEREKVNTNARKKCISQNIFFNSKNPDLFFEKRNTKLIFMIFQKKVTKYPDFSSVF